MLDEIWAVVEAQLQDLKAKTFDDLRNFVGQPRCWKAHIRGKSIDFGIEAELHEANRLAVIVEGRRNFILGMSRVVANGFYKTTDGAVTPFEQRDLWIHGY